MVAAHAARLAWAGPCRQPPDLLLGVEEGLHVAPLLRRMQDVCQGELAAECVPKAIVREHVAVVDLAVVGTIIIRCAVLLDFIELAGEEVSAEEAGVERAKLFLCSAFHSDTVQQGVPRLKAPFLCLLQGFVGSQLAFQYQYSLFVANVRRGCFSLNLRS